MRGFTYFALCFNRVSICILFKVIRQYYPVFYRTNINIYNNETFQPSGEFNIPGSFIAPYK